MKQLGTQPLKTPRLLLRRYTPMDAQAMFEGWANDPKVTQYLMWETHPDVAVTQAILDTWIAQYDELGYYNWGIEKDGILIGNIAVVRCDSQNELGEVGYALGRAYWGQGIMSEALQAVLAFLFEEVGLHRVFMQHEVANGASGRVMAKNGLVQEGVLRKQHLGKDGTWSDLVLYGILQEEWRLRKAAKERV